jgi:hypothetical protein
MRRLRRALAALFLVALGLGLCGLVTRPFFGDAVEEYFSRVPFDSAAWKAAEPDVANPVRLRMVDDLLRRHRLVGKGKAEIDELLGRPTQTGHFADYDYVYWLGPERGFISIDSEWLVLKLEHGKVVQARVVRD